MKRTRPGTIVILVVAGILAGWFIDTGLTAAGQHVIMLPVTLPPVLAVIGGIVVLLALPIFRLTRGTAKKYVDHLYATRVVMLAKASSLTGALITGVALGICGFLLSRAVLPGLSQFSLPVATLAGAVILLAAGLLAEWFCTIPPASGEDDDQPGKQPADVQS
ncbi:MAG: DUF3180 domain-containing protein [Microbacteriaceae bacterium]